MAGISRNTVDKQLREVERLVLNAETRSYAAGYVLLLSAMESVVCCR